MRVAFSSSISAVRWPKRALPSCSFGCQQPLKELSILHWGGLSTTATAWVSIPGSWKSTRARWGDSRCDRSHVSVAERHLCHPWSISCIPPYVLLSCRERVFQSRIRHSNRLAAVPRCKDQGCRGARSCHSHDDYGSWSSKGLRIAKNWTLQTAYHYHLESSWLEKNWSMGSSYCFGYL